jgi:2-methylcitrate dehydratase PrpD
VRAASAGPTQQLAEFVAAVRFQDLPTEVVTQACQVVLDAVGCAAAAWQEDPRKARIAVALVEEFRAAEEAIVIGAGRTHPALAALANGVLVNAADNDDTHKRALIHVGSVVVPAALAVSEARALGGPELIAAVVAGYEVAARVGMAVMPSHYRFWHSTATNGTFGAAAAAARAMGLDGGAVRMALGFAGTQAAGLNTFFETGDDSKSLHPGKAGMNGVLAARLAALGATSPPTILEHAKGYLAAYSAEAKADRLTEGLGRRWEILENGFKFYPSILASHSPIGATLQLVHRHPVPPERIRRITNHTYGTVKSHFSSKAVESSMAARLSVPYCIAVAAVDREVTQRQFQPERFGDPLVRRVLERTEIVADPELDALYPEKFPARVVIEMEDGARHEAAVMYPKGDPRDPLTAAELDAKFRTNARALLTEVEASALAEAIRGLPGVASVRDLTRCLGRRPPGATVGVHGMW